MQYSDIPLEATDGNTYSLSDFKGQKLVVYFYPKDNTTGCTLEAKDFTQLKDAFSEKGYKIIGVSKDSIRKHHNFIEKQNLDLLLLSDPEQVLIKALDLLKEKTLYGKTYMGVVRSTFVLNEQGEIINEFINVKAKNHAQDVLDKLA